MVTISTLAKSGLPSKKEMKKRQKRTEPEMFIKKGDKTYAIQPTTFRNLAIDFYDLVEAESAKNGQDDIGKMEKNCLFCNYNQDNIYNFTLGESEDYSLDGCTYSSDILVASEFVNTRTRTRFYAQEGPCVIQEAMVKVLIEKGKLTSYERAVDFKFKLIEEFEKGTAKETDFKIHRPSLTKSLLDILRI